MTGGWIAQAGRSRWRQALGLDEATGTPSAGGIPVYLHARGVRSGVMVSVAATVFDGGEDSRRASPAARTTPRPGSTGLLPACWRS